MISNNLSTSKLNTQYLVKEKYGMLYLNLGGETLSQIFQNAEIEYNLDTRNALRNYILNTKNLAIHFNGVLLPEEAYQQTVGMSTLSDFLLAKGINHGFEFSSIDFQGSNDEKLSYNEFLKDKFNHFRQKLKASFVHITENFSMVESSIKTGIEDSIHTKVFRLANIVRRAQEAGLAVVVDLNILEHRTLTFDELFIRLERLMFKINFAFNDNQIFWENLVFALPIIGTNRVNQHHKNRRITHEEVIFRNFISWKRTIVPALQLIYAKFTSINSTSEAFNDCCFFINEIAKIEIKKPWVISFAVGSLLYGNSMLYWKNEFKNETLASGLIFKRMEAIRAAMGGEFKPEMGKEATYENTVKEYELKNLENEKKPSENEKKNQNLRRKPLKVINESEI